MQVIIRALSKFSALMLIVGYGVLIGLDVAPPSGLRNMVQNAHHELSDFAKHWRHDLGIDPTRMVVDRPENPFARVDLDSTLRMAGYRLIGGYFPDLNAEWGAILLDENNEILHAWPFDYGDFVPPGRNRNISQQGLAVFEDGSLVINYDVGEVLMRLGPCGDVIWKTEGIFHHVVHRSFDGTLWTWESQSMVQIDPQTGERLRTISIKNDIAAKSGYLGAFTMRTEAQENGIKYFPEAYHANDIEVLTPEFADAFPLFEAGDIMFSLREVNLVAVIDHQTLDIKWVQNGPWHRQHDPDFLPDGTISVYDNRMGSGSSQIIRIDPVTGKFAATLGREKGISYYSWQRGKHQVLANGNIIVTDPEGGQAFEATEDGTVVWHFENRFDETRNGVVTTALNLPTDFFSAGALDCSEADKP